MGSIYSSYDYYDRKKRELVEWVLSVSFMNVLPYAGIYVSTSSTIDRSHRRNNNIQS